MTTSNELGGSGRAASSFPRAFFEDWMLQLVLVAGVVAAMIQGVLSLSGAALG